MDTAKEKSMETYKKEKREVKMGIYQSNMEVNKQFGRKMKQDVNGNRKLFREEVSNVNGGKVEEQRIWKDYFEDIL